MLRPRTANTSSSCATTDSSAAFARTVGNTTNVYVMTFTSASSTVKDIKLNSNQSAAILSSLDALCGTPKQKPGASTNLCLSNKTQNPCEGLTAPNGVASIARCPNTGLYIAQTVIAKDADTFYSGIYSLIVPIN